MRSRVCLGPRLAASLIEVQVLRWPSHHTLDKCHRVPLSDASYVRVSRQGPRDWRLVLQSIARLPCNLGQIKFATIPVAWYRAPTHGTASHLTVSLTVTVRCISYDLLFQAPCSSTTLGPGMVVWYAQRVGTTVITHRCYY